MLLRTLILAVRLLDVSFQSAGISRATASEGSILPGRPMPIVIAVTVSAGHSLGLVRSHLSVSLDLADSDLASTSNMPLLSTSKATLLIGEGSWAISNPMPLVVLARKIWQSADTTNLSCYKQSTVGTLPFLASGPLAAAPRPHAHDAAVTALDTGLAHHDGLGHLADLDAGQANDSDHGLAVSLAVLLPPVRNLVFVQPGADGVDLASSRHRHRQ